MGTGKVAKFSVPISYIRWPARFFIRKICVIRFLLLFLHSFCPSWAFTKKIMNKDTKD